MTHQPSLQMSLLKYQEVWQAYSKKTTQDVTNRGRKMVAHCEMLSVLRPNQLVSDQKMTLLGPEAAEFMTQYVISSHFCSTHHAMLLSCILQTIRLCGNHHLITATATRPEAWPHPLRFLFGGTCGKQEMAEYRLALKPTGMHTYTHACTSLMCTVRCLSGWQGFLSSIHLSTVTGRWQTSVSMFLSPTGESWS